MIELKNEKIAIPVVLFAGLLWSFGPLVVRYMDNPDMVPWQYIFGRGLTIFVLLNLYLYFEEGFNFYKNYKRIGRSGIIGGCGLGIAMISFIYSITNTSAAITLLCLAAMPFFTAILAYLFLKEKISINVWVSILIASIGIIIMALGNTEKGIYGREGINCKAVRRMSPYPYSGLRFGCDFNYNATTQDISITNIAYVDGTSYSPDPHYKFTGMNIFLSGSGLNFNASNKTAPATNIIKISKNVIM